MGERRYPAMVAAIRDIHTDELVGIHRTALRADGSWKADMPSGASDKMMLGRAKGAAIKLVGHCEVTLGLGIAEGIENALTVLCNGWSPVWAAGSAGAIAEFPVLPGVEALTIFADPGQRGQSDATTCALRCQEAGVEATIITPPDDRDWNKWKAA
jgi:putative DNA primase/helicase